MVEQFFASVGRNTPYTAEDIKAQYRIAGNPANLMVRIVQELAQQLAEEEPSSTHG